MIKILGRDTVINQVGERHRKLRRIFTSNFFNSDGIALYVPRMDAISRDHIAKHGEGKESILGVPAVREFTFSAAADIFMSLRETDPRFRSLYQTMEDVISGVLQFPINLPGTDSTKDGLGVEKRTISLIPSCGRKQGYSAESNCFTLEQGAGARKGFINGF